VPGYAASHGCVRLPPAFAEALFKLTKASATTVVIGDEPLESEVQAQQFALNNSLPVRAALAPKPKPKPADMAGPALSLTRMALALTPPQPGPRAPIPVPPPPPPAATPGAGGQIAQLAAAPSQAEAEAHWARLLQSHPELSRYRKSVEAAQVNARTVYRLRISGPDAHRACATLNSAGINCFSVN
jgi:hypothetical protein